MALVASHFAIVFTLWKQISLDHRLQIGNMAIEVVETIKTLGVFFNCTMSWDSQINLIANLSKYAGILA